MFDIAQELNRWIESDKDFTIATVIKTWGSGPRKVGSGMAIAYDNSIIGSVSGGCVEGDVVRQREALSAQSNRKTVHYGVSDEQAWEVGLSCGGQIEILLEKPNYAVWKALTDRINNNVGSVLISGLDNDESSLLFTPEDPKKSPLGSLALEAYRTRKSGVYELEDQRYFLNVFPKKSQLIIVGAAHISSELVQQSSYHGFETMVIDPRGLFANQTVFSVQADQTFEKWPEEVLKDFDLNSDVYTVMLTHDPKIDDQALHILLRSDVAYIGALGSKKTHAKRVARLTEAGFTENEISRIHAPIGVDINAQSPGEIALSIVAELVKTRNQYL